MIPALGFSAILSALLCAFYMKLLLPYYGGKYYLESTDRAARPAYLIPVSFITAAAAFILILMRGGEGIYLAGNLFIGAVLLAISAIDLSFRKIPNELVLVIMLWAVFLGIYQSSHIADIFSGGIAASLLPAAAGLLGGKIGAGDIKLMFSVGLCLGLWLAISFFAITFILAAFILLFLFFFKKITPKTKVPLAPFMAAAFVFTACFDYFIIDFWRIII